MTKKLDLYNAKRNFAKTSEPAGRVSRTSTAKGRKPNTQLRFVIQKHAATRLHYDFRLELDGVMKSWAVTRGPSIDPADKRLAVEVEDHPLAYGDFEGTIPAGEYGGGTVQLWDRGYWQPQATKSPAASLKAGELKFELFGERLTGSWVLVRMRDDRDSKRHNWLLIKHRDAASKSDSATQRKRDQRAAAKLMDEDASIASGRSMAQIAAGKGKAPKASINEVATPKKQRTTPSSKKTATTSTRSKTSVIKHLPTFVEPALCKLMTAAPDGDDWLHEIKLDGYRLQLRVADGRATLRTRKGLDWTDRFSSLANAAKSLPPCVIDGEAVALDAHGNPSFAALQAALTEHDSSKLIFFAFDLLFLNKHDLRKSPLLDRKTQLQELLDALPAHSQLRYVDHVLGNGADVLKSACRMKLEGVVSKRIDAAYASGRGDAWIKTKCRAGHEVVIGGMTSEAGQLRSLLVGVMREGELIYVGRVGTGYGEKTSKMVMPKLKAVIAKANPFHGDTAPRKERNVTWLKPELVAEIQFAGWTGGGMVRQASFKGLRLDKPAAEVQAETPSTTAPIKTVATLSKGKAPVSKRTTSKQSVDATARSNIQITHPEKILWPASKTGQAFTKLDLAHYYQEVNEWMLPHVQGRPCSIVRAPDGIKGEQFFQRHAMRGNRAALKTMQLAGDHQPYLMIDSSAALTAVAQLGALELHPGNCVPAHPEAPGRLVFDLDPAPDVDFKTVVKAALELRERLEQLGMTAFCKTTGGKGLHVVVPLATSKRKSEHAVDWRTAKLFTQTLCAQMASDSPQSYLINMSKAQRHGRIFLDYLRNDRLATAVAPLSPRARPGAPVSMPLQWQQVKAGLDPLRFTINTAASLLRKSQPWSVYADTGSSLEAAMKVLVKQHRRVG